MKSIIEFVIERSNGELTSELLLGHICPHEFNSEHGKGWVSQAIAMAESQGMGAIVACGVGVGQ